MPEPEPSSCWPLTLILTTEGSTDLATRLDRVGRRGDVLAGARPGELCGPRRGRLRAGAAPDQVVDRGEPGSASQAAESTHDEGRRQEGGDDRAARTGRPRANRLALLRAVSEAEPAEPCGVARSEVRRATASAGAYGVGRAGQGWSRPGRRTGGRPRGWSPVDPGVRCVVVGSLPSFGFCSVMHAKHGGCRLKCR